ncbi:hypothetical protein Zmor_018274 [Zophobas morio]|uniref:Gustatory receptor n=1 Tax=Zophobas morio TaxID=2755281 RepID=A0AA38MDR4_9CUCU|nr:hypothetical protein Zmor_018274 [Zophobas morio]
MSFELLNSYLKVGKYLSITPTSIETDKISKFRQVHQVLMILFIITCVMISVYLRNFYLEYNLAKVTVCLLTDIVLCVFCCRVIVEASKVLEWAELINGLKNTSYLLEENNKGKEKRIQWKFVLPQVFFCINAIYITHFWFSIVGLIQLEQYGFELLENYIQFFYTFYVHTILEMIRQRYEALKRQVDDYKNVDQMGHSACILMDTVNRFNRSFGWSLLLLIAFTTLQFLNYMEYNLQSQEYGKENVYQVVISQILSILVSFVPTSMLLLKCNRITEESEDIVFLVSKSGTRILDLKIREKADRFGDILARNLPQFSAARFFALGRSTILSIFGTVATFFIVLVTFAPNWSELISGLKNTSCLLEEDDNDKRKWIQWKFVLPQLTFFIAVIYILRTWFSVLGLLEFGYVFELVQIYLQFCHSLYLHTLLEMIRQRYEALKRYFEKGFSRNDKNLHQMSCFACTLKDTVNRFNEIFGWSLLFLIAFTTLQFLNSLEYSLEYNEFGKENASHIVISQVITVLLSFLPTSILLLKFENIMAEFDNIVFLRSEQFDPPTTVSTFVDRLPVLYRFWNRRPRANNRVTVTGFFLSPSEVGTVVHASLPSPRSPPGSPCRLRAISRSQGRRSQSQEEPVLKAVGAVPDI